MFLVCVDFGSRFLIPKHVLSDGVTAGDKKADITRKDPLLIADLDTSYIDGQEDGLNEALCFPANKRDIFATGEGSGYDSNVDKDALPVGKRSSDSKFISEKYEEYLISLKKHTPDSDIVSFWLISCC